MASTVPFARRNLAVDRRTQTAQCRRSLYQSRWDLDQRSLVPF